MVTFVASRLVAATKDLPPVPAAQPPSSTAPPDPEGLAAASLDAPIPSVATQPPVAARRESQPTTDSDEDWPEMMAPPRPGVAPPPSRPGW